MISPGTLYGPSDLSLIFQQPTMQRLLGDTNLHIGLAVAFIACGAAYKYIWRPRQRQRQHLLLNQAELNDWPELEEDGDLLGEDEIWAEEDFEPYEEGGIGEENQEEWQRYDDLFNDVPIEGPGGIARPANHMDINPPPAATHDGSSRSSRNRKVGAKKAKSLARRDRVRAYNEYLRQQGAAERYAQKEFEEKYGDLIEQARMERQRREEIAGEKLKLRQQQKRDQEEQERRRKQEIRARLVETLERQGNVQLSNEEEQSIATTISDGLVVGEGRWLIQLNSDQIELVASTIKAKGKASYREIAEVLEKNAR